MNEIVKSHDFEKAKGHIQKFSKKIDSNVHLDKVETSGGLFGWFNHNVTGEELNKLTGKIQENIISINKYIKSFFDEFGQVYNALEALQKDYITGIILAVKGAEESSNQAKKACDKIQIAQKDINKVIEEQKKIIGVLFKHKKKLESIKHLGDIDDTWTDVSIIKKKINDLISNCNYLNTQLEDFTNEFKILETNRFNSIKHIEEELFDIKSFQSRLQNQKYLMEVDNIYSSMEDCDKKVELLQEKFSLFENDYSNLIKFFEQAEEQNKDNFEKINFKVKIAIYVAGSATLLAITNLFLNIIGVI